MSRPRRLGKYELDNVRLPAGTAAEAVALFAAQDPSRLGVLIVNSEINRFVAEYNVVDYQGWVWRPVDFFTPCGVTIADGDGRVAICQNNKWDYPQRDLTESEQAHFLGLVWMAYEESRKGGLLSDILDKTKKLLNEANDFILSLEIKEQA